MDTDTTPLLHSGSLNTRPFSKMPGHSEVPPSALCVSSEGEITPAWGVVLIFFTA